MVTLPRCSRSVHAKVGEHGAEHARQDACGSKMIMHRARKSKRALLLDAVGAFVAGVVCVPWSMFVHTVFRAVSPLAVLWLICVMTPPTLAVVLGSGVLLERWGRRQVVGYMIVSLAMAGLLLGGIWFLLAFVISPSPVIPVRLWE